MGGLELARVGRITLRMATDLAKMREVVMAGTLKEEEGSENLPGQRATRSAIDGFAAELEIPLMNKFLNGRSTIIHETPIQPFINGLQISRVVKVTIKQAAMAQGEGGRIGMQGADKTRKFPPREFEGKLEEDGFEEEADGKNRFPALILSIFIQLILEGPDDGFDQAPLLVGEEETSGGSGFNG